MKRVAASLALSIVLAGSFASTNPAARSPLKLGARWDVTGARTADVTCDGVPDTITAGYGKKTLFISVVPGGRSGARNAINFTFPVDPGQQAAVCAVPVHIDVEPISCEDGEYGHLDGCHPKRGCRAFAVVDGQCDSLFFYWNADSRRLEWFRH